MSTRYVSIGCVEVLGPLVLMAALSAADFARADDAVSMLQHYKCYVCHANDETRTGPAYADVAAHYRGNPKAVAVLEATIKRGAHGTGPWHMPPHPEISNADARTMARYILSLRFPADKGRTKDAQ
jgi:cytochrome c551/c552